MARNLGLIRQNYNLLFTKPQFRQIFRNYAKLKPKKDDPYVIIRALSNDFKEIMDLMWSSYFPHEPSASSIGLGNKRNPIIDEVLMRCLSEGLSVAAKCKYTGKIVGACLNESTVPWDPDKMDRLACSISCVKTRHLFHFWAFLQRAPKLWDKFQVQKVLELSHLAVKRSERGRGLAKKLVISGVDTAFDAGYTVVRVDATNYYTAKLCKSLNFRLIYELPYCTYLGHDNKPIFNTLTPHRSVKVYVFESTMTLNR